MSLINILIGWGNLALDQFNLLPPTIKEMSEKRLEICNVCPVRAHNSCDTTKAIINIETGFTVYGCGCNLQAKVLDPNSACPASKWKQEKLI